ncbi:hypothetical protein [Schauerella aestuarii]|uniref:hypothetical protein n=1 Tax=Schauerella aestuarii TaxID=2511204 RepID=UPI00136EA1DD|nr:hypothetical protein [Achromobacter aestuarii]MYZ44197.1 hypothetical protein [Achromobacter aestuarii]
MSKQKQARVLVVGAVDGSLTDDGSGSQGFASEDAALEVFPDLRLDADGERFTRGRADPDGSIRFETWAAANALSR